MAQYEAQYAVRPKSEEAVASLASMVVTPLVRVIKTKKKKTLVLWYPPNGKLYRSTTPLL